MTALSSRVRKISLGMSFFQSLKGSRRGSMPINKTVGFALAVIIGVVILSVVLQTMFGLMDFGACSGPFKGLFSTLADMTGADMC